MSQITTSFDLFHAKVSTLLPQGSGYFELSNPYELVDNSNLFLRKGWGIAIGPGRNTNRELCGKITVERTIRVILTRALEALEQDPTTKNNVIKALMEDAFTILQDFERSYRLDDDEFNCRFESDGGIQSLAVDNYSYLTLEMIFNVELFDNP